MSTVTNNTSSRSDAQEARRTLIANRRPGRTREDTEASSNGGAFDQLILTARSDLGRALGVRSVDSGLEGQMFESTPDDPRAQRLSQEQDAQSQDSKSDARTLRFERPDQPNTNAGASQGVDGTSPIRVGGDQAVSGSNETASSRTPDVPRPVETLTSSRPGQTTPGASGRADAAGARGAQPANDAPGSTATASGSGIVAPAISAASNGEATGTRGGTARQVAQILQTSGDATTARTTATAPTDGRSPQGDRNTGQDLQRQASTRESDSSPSSRNTARSTEPTPFDDLVRSIRLNTRSDFSTARIRLDPPELGRMQVDVELNGTQLTLKVRTETNEAAQRVQSRVNELKTALEQHGILIDSVDVSIDGERANASSHGMNQEARDSAAQDSTRMNRNEPRPTDDGVDEVRDAWDEIDVGRFWGGAEWFGTARGRVDVRV